MVWVAQAVHFQNPLGGLWSPLRHLRNSIWHPRWPPIHKHGYNFLRNLTQFVTNDGSNHTE